MAGQAAGGCGRIAATVRRKADNCTIYALLPCLLEDEINLYQLIWTSSTSGHSRFWMMSDPWIRLRCSETQGLFVLGEEHLWRPFFFG